MDERHLRAKAMLAAGLEGLKVAAETGLSQQVVSSLRKCLCEGRPKHLITATRTHGK